MLPRREQNRNDQRARIVEAARRLFARGSVDEVTMAEVAADAGVARATVFNHFGSKHALMEAITEDVIAHYQGMLRNALEDTTTSTPVLVRALFEQMGAGIEEDQRFYRGVFREIAKIRLGLDEGGLGEQAGRAALELLVKLLARGQERGDLSRALRAEDLASAFDSLVNGTITSVDPYVYLPASGFPGGDNSTSLTVHFNATSSTAVLAWGGQEDWPVLAQLVLLAHLPIVAIEGIIVGFTIRFLAQVKPEMLGLVLREKRECPVESLP